MIPRVLVTGASGFLGNYVVRELLQRNYVVRVLVRPGAELGLLAELPLELCLGDVTSPADLERAVASCAYVIHAAALVSVNPARSSAHWRVNVDGTQHLLWAARQAKVQRFVYVGTANVFGYGSLTQPGTEEQPYTGYRYRLDYMDSKRVATDHVLAAARAGFPAVLVHPTFMLGAWATKRTSGALLAELAERRVPGYPPGGKNYVHVADVAVATVNALTMGRVGESYILGHENLSYQAAFRLMAEELKIAPPQLPLPSLLVRLYGQLNDWKALLTGRPGSINAAMARVACNGHYFSCQKAIRELALPQTPIRNAVQEAAVTLV